MDDVDDAPAVAAPKAAPAPPKKVEDFSFVCRLCGTRLYAKPAEEGRTKSCPDCHTPNVVPKFTSKGPAAGPATVDSPMIASITRQQLPAAAPPVASPDVDVEYDEPELRDQDDGSGDDFSLSEPVDLSHVHTIQKSPIRLPTLDEAENGKWDDREYGVIQLTGSPDDWKQSPFFLNVADILLDPGLLLRSAAYFIGFCMLGLFFMTLRTAEGLVLSTSLQIAATVSLPFVAVIVVSWMSSFVSMVTDTANGIVKVELPWFESSDWAGRGIKGTIALAISLAPGAIAWFVAPDESWIVLVFPIVSFAVMFPVVLGSLLKEDSWTHFISLDLLKTMKSQSEKWLIFHLSSSVVLGVALVGVLLFFASTLPKVIMGTALALAMFWLYARLLGRIYWLLSEASKNAPRPRPDNTPKPPQHPMNRTEPTALLK